jgi:hypothetical protein
MSTLVEIDTRTIPGTNGGSVVVWELSRNGDRHQITLHATGSAPRTVYRGSDAVKAHDAFTHTFAYEDVPNVFAHESLTPVGV